MTQFLENMEKENFYIDELKNAVLSITIDDDGNEAFEGTIGDDLLIHPISRDYFLNMTSSREFMRLNHFNKNDQPHIILHRSKKIKAQKWAKNVRGVKKINPKLPPQRDIVVYPELLIFIDEELFGKLYYNARYAIRYILTTFYGVDLLFRPLSNPTIRFSIAGIVIVKSSMEYILSGASRKNSRPHKLVEDFGKFLPKINNQFVYKKDYDIGILMTGSSLTEAADEAPTMGVAFIKGVCQNITETSNDAYDEFTTEVYKSSVIAVDNAAYGGIMTATHELGHILGASHDTNKHKECEWGDSGYIMSYSGGYSNRIRFSPCSQRQISKTLLSKGAKCVYNPPPKDEPLNVPLPGKLTTMDDQCFKNDKTSFCAIRKDDPYRCVKLICENSNITARAEEPCTEQYFAPAEGTPCGNNKICLHGECVNKPSTMDYNKKKYYDKYKYNIV
ncbi:A disintegrin and metalloproteinase with thrombospondin motifs 15-like isoform X2 [Leptopilina heterotoma]|uniref:A disintegrin and metalloproteinase with thrombospondin motifs 15-like isoform X2 n=1 Tax=Leptopilina heterotoma TaxID=63436 RepID=UPI001CA9AE35|nr:A disintegrin and metalloproteinase with thrombospondin motifs 15-like isoform X2 [Leptopilina heterotoma]